MFFSLVTVFFYLFCQQSLHWIGRHRLYHFFITFVVNKRIMELIREIIVPTGNSYILTLPDEMIGKRVEVIAFELNKDVSVNDETTLDQTQTVTDIREIFKGNLLDMSNFTFNRDEANNYNE